MNTTWIIVVLVILAAVLMAIVGVLIYGIGSLLNLLMTVVDDVGKEFYDAKR